MKRSENHRRGVHPQHVDKLFRHVVLRVVPLCSSDGSKREVAVKYFVQHIRREAFQDF
jgi:hypothetical protein